MGNEEIEVIEITKYQDECPVCGVWMLNRKKHLEWHQTILTIVGLLESKIARIKINPFTSQPFLSDEAPE